jgi:glyoxylase-like metal-dependent hydrolase (beta-lactamase superfamily II)
MAAELIVPGVYRILKGYVNAYLIEAEGGLTVVDCGMPKKAERLLAAVRESGHDSTGVQSIVITHHHADHVGSLAALVAATGATVYAPALDTAIIRGQTARPRPNTRVITGRLLGPLLVRFEPKVQPAAIDQEVTEGDGLPLPAGLTAIFTPGHTAGHTSYLLAGRDGGILFAGDAAGARGSKAAPPVDAVFGMFTEDLDEARRSFAKLAGMQFEVMLPGHGKPIREGASRAFGKAAAR